MSTENYIHSLLEKEEAGNFALCQTVEYLFSIGEE